MGSDDGAGRVLNVLLRNYTDPRVHKYALSWLEDNSIELKSWLLIWNYFQHRMKKNDEFHRIEIIGITKLENISSSKLHASDSWSLLWNWIWKLGTNREKLTELAGKMSFRQPSRGFVEYVAFANLTTDFADGRIVDCARAWLSNNVRSTLLWVKLYLIIFKRDGADSMVNTGLIWLQNCGGNINKWRDIWRALDDRISRAERMELALSWLRRSRWDLTSWPLVFNDLAMMANNTTEVNQLINLADRWKNYQANSSHISSRVDKALKYLKEQRYE